MENIIFDFGNVLVRFEPRQFYKRHFGDDARAWWFMRHVATHEWLNRIDAGEPTGQCVADLASRYPDYREAIEMYGTRFDEMLTGEVPGMKALLELLRRKPGVSLFGLTNWSMETFPQARERFAILQMIDRYVVSGAEGLVKPDPRLFRLLLDRFGLEEGGCVFIDDNEANVAAATALGMKGIVFSGADDLRRSLGLYRGLTADEAARLASQGCSADDWGNISICDDTDLGAIRRTHFKGAVSIGPGCTLEDSHVEQCVVDSGCTVARTGLLRNYHLEAGCTVEGVGEMSHSTSPVGIDVMNENGGRRIVASPGMTVADAYLAARFRDRRELQARLDGFAKPEATGVAGQGCRLTGATAVVDGQLGPGCHVGHGVIAERFVLGENVTLDAALRLNDTVVGDNSTLARGEVGCSLIFPAHEQHHNSSFLMAALVQGQSNVASGATLGSNHNSRTPDGELSAGRGFWPGLCVSVKHSSRFASYTLLAKADYPGELNITLPFSLVSNNVQKNRLEVMPAYWWMYNMYALHRNIDKYAWRDRRQAGRQHIVFSPFAPDTAEEIIVGRELLRLWTARAYHENGGTEVMAYGMERGSSTRPSAQSEGRRKTVILKPGEAYRAYEEMLVYYAMEVLGQTPGFTPSGNARRTRRWVNLGGQLLAGDDADRLLADIENGSLSSWRDIEARLDQLWADYPDRLADHAYAVLCHLAQKNRLDDDDRRRFDSQYAAIKQLVADRIAASRKKDADNEFRQSTFWNTAEMHAVLGS